MWGFPEACLIGSGLRLPDPGHVLVPLYRGGSRFESRLIWLGPWDCFTPVGFASGPGFIINKEDFLEVSGVWLLDRTWLPYVFFY